MIDLFLRYGATILLVLAAIPFAGLAALTIYDKIRDSINGRGDWRP